MADERAWFTAVAKRRVTATEISDLLGVSRRTATNRLNEGLSADDLIVIARGLNVSPVNALVELGKLTYQEVFDFLDGDGTLLASATQEQLVRTLAEDVLPLSDRIEIGAAAKALADKRDELADRRAALSESNEQGHPSPGDKDDGTVRQWEDHPHAADSSPDEDRLREEEGADPID